MPSKKKLQVFVSSTFIDLKSERQAAVEAILKASHIPAGMELFSASNESQMETIRRWIDESDVYMLILGGRYGSVDSNTSLSYTELEYDYAVSKNKPFFAVVINESALNEKVKIEGRHVLEAEFPKELKAFREKALSKISSFFSDAKDIKLAVHETLAEFQQRHEFKGWIPGNEGVDLAPLLEEIVSLKRERDDLKRQISAVSNNSEASSLNSSEKWSENELRQILQALKEMEISTKIFNKSDEDVAKRYSIDKIIDSMRDSLITGVTNRMSATKRESLLYYNVCPKLELYDLAAPEKIDGTNITRYRLTAKGKAVIVFLDKQKQIIKKKEKVNVDVPG